MLDMRSLKFIRMATLIMLAIAMFSICSNIAATRNHLSSWSGLHQQTLPFNGTSKSSLSTGSMARSQDTTNSQIVHDKITLVTQLSRDRLLMLKEMVEAWTGPISAAVFLKKEQFGDFDRFLSHNSQRSKII